MKTETIYGFHPVMEALRAGRRKIYEIHVMEGKSSKRLEIIKKLAESRNFSIKKVRPAQLQSLTGSNQHQGVSAKVSSYPLVNFSSLLEKSMIDKQESFFLMLDGLNDPNNLGAIIRTAAAFGGNGVIIPKDRSVSPTPAVSKASAGTLEYVQVSKVTNIVNTIKELKDNGFWIYGLVPGTNSSIFNMDLSGPLAMIIGGEEKGIRPLVKEKCDFLVSIPQSGQVESLNASVAGAIVMYEVYRQRSSESIR